MNNDEYAQQTPQDFVMKIVDDLTQRSLFEPNLSFRISLVGFSDQIVHSVALSEFSFKANRNGEYVRERMMTGLNMLQDWSKNRIVRTNIRDTFTFVR